MKPTKHMSNADIINILTDFIKNNNKANIRCLPRHSPAYYVDIYKASTLVCSVQQRNNMYHVKFVKDISVKPFKNMPDNEILISQNNNKEFTGMQEFIKLCAFKDKEQRENAALKTRTQLRTNIQKLLQTIKERMQ